MKKDNFLRNKFKNIYETIPTETLVERPGVEIIRKITEKGLHATKDSSVETQIHYLFIKPQAEKILSFSFLKIIYKTEEKKFIFEIDNFKKFVKECKKYDLTEGDLKFILDDLLETTRKIMVYYEFESDNIENLQKNIKNFFEMYSGIKSD